MELIDRWKNLGNRLCRDENFEKGFSRIKRTYNSQNRVYHNLDHIRFCLKEFEDLQTYIDDPSAVEVALWFHDLVYDPKGEDNEQRSAKKCVAFLKNHGIKEPWRKLVFDLIIATDHKSEPQTLDQKFMVDIDLAILGVSESCFDSYERAIRQEYSWVPEREFRIKRKEFLQRFLNRASIFFTIPCREKWETRARENLMRVIREK